MAINFSVGNDAFDLGAPPRTVYSYDTGRSGCPPADAAFTPTCVISFTITNSSAIYVVGRNIRYFNGRVDWYLYGAGPNSWGAGTLLRVRLNYTNGLNWETNTIRWTGFLTTIGTYSFWMATSSASSWGCPDDTTSRYGYLGALILEC